MSVCMCFTRGVCDLFPIPPLPGKPTYAVSGSSVYCLFRFGGVIKNMPKHDFPPEKHIFVFLSAVFNLFCP